MSVKTPHRTRCPVFNLTQDAAGNAECQFGAPPRLTEWSGSPGLQAPGDGDWLLAVGYGFTGMPRPGSTWPEGIAATRRPGRRSLEPRIPEPMITEPVLATASSTSTGQSAGSPTGVIPPYSIPVAAVTASTGANDAFLASRCLRTSPFTSARVVARTMQAAYIVFPPRLPAMTTQFADSVGKTPYRSQNAAVSASAGSISAPRTSSPPAQSRNATATGAASNSGRDNAGTKDSTSLMRPIQPSRRRLRVPVPVSLTQRACSYVYNVTSTRKTSRGLGSSPAPEG